MNYKFNKEFTKQHYLKYYVLAQRISGTLWLVCFLYIAVLMLLRLQLNITINEFFGYLALLSTLYVMLFGILIFSTTAVFNIKFLSKYKNSVLDISFGEDGIYFVDDTNGDYYWVAGFLIKRHNHTDVIRKVADVKITAQYIIIYGEIEQQYTHNVYRGQKVKIKRCYDNEEMLLEKIRKYM